uniref:Uncharacterized protein n=1 Tax=Rangifer tarandus platyrhynchus TaxID=3082113 RepID=A0ACB0FD06_RANTA|nr:unnamed protein product [Rangifer tarandus platyrhynchus]
MLSKHRLRFCLGNYSGISSLVVVKVSKADLLSRGQKEIQQISEESLDQLEWKETKLAREQDHGMPRAREHSHRCQPPVRRANSTSTIWFMIFHLEPYARLRAAAASAGLLGPREGSRHAPLQPPGRGRLGRHSLPVAAGQAYHWMGTQFFSSSADVAFWPLKLITWAETGRHEWSTDKAPVQSRGRALLLSPSRTARQLSGPAASSSQQPEAGDSAEKENEGTQAQQLGP